MSEIKLNLSTLLIILSVSVLLAFLANDFVIDFFADLSIQHGYYCTLLHSFDTIPGVLRLLIPCGMLAVGVIASQRFLLFVIAMAGLPLLLRNMMLVHSACMEDPKDWISTELKISHCYMLVLFAVILSMALTTEGVENKPSNKKIKANTTATTEGGERSDDTSTNKKAK